MILKREITGEEGKKTIAGKEIEKEKKPDHG
jgi:hypothetical protein